MSRNGQTIGNIERAVNGSVAGNIVNHRELASAVAEAEWDSGDILNGNGRGFTLYLLPKVFFPHSRSGSLLYQALCEMVGLQTVGNGFQYTDESHRYHSYWSNCNNN